LYYDRSVQGLYAHDIGQAQALLAAAGYSDSDNDGYLDIGGVTVTLDVIVPPWGLAPQVAELLQDQWRTIGIRATLKPVPTVGSLLDAVATGEYNLVAFNAFGLDPMLLNDFYLSDGANNYSGYVNDELDDVLREATRQTDTAVRAGLYARAQQIIMNEALVLPIRDQVNLNASSAAITNLQFDPYGWFPLLNNVVSATA
jgi:peptide/nickel transport system substrate-binding protein